LDLGYIQYKDEKYLHDVNGKDIYAEVANKAINDENGENIDQTYLKKSEQATYQTDADGNIIAINNVPIAAATGSLPLRGEDGIYVRNDITANIIGISANYAYASALSGYQTKLSQEQMQDIESIPFKLDKTEFNETISSYATKQYVNNKIADIGSPLVIRGSKTCAEIAALTDMKVGDVYCVTDTGKIGDLDVNVNDEVAYTEENGWIVIGRDIAVDLSDYYKKEETSGASQISAALDSVDQKFDNYYTTTQTSGAGEISSALASKVDSSAMTDYYTKTDTSSKEELNVAFGNKADSSALSNYVTNTDLATNYYDKTETSSKEQISGALDSKADKTDLDLYYTMAETSGAEELSSAFDNKQDKLTFGWDGDGKIISINNSAIAGQGGASFTGDVQGALDEVYTNSSVWLTAHQDLSNYVTNDTLSSNYYDIDEMNTFLEGVQSAIDEKVDNDFLQENYYNITETSAASEIASALDEKLDVTAFETSATAWNDTTNVVRSNSANWGAGDEEVNELVHSNSGTWNNVSSKLDSSAIDDYYTKDEVDSLMDGKVVVLTELPASGNAGTIYYIGPNPSVSGDDKYEEYIWDSTNEEFIQVGEHSLDLSGYATDEELENSLAEVYDYVDTSLDDKLDTTAIEGTNNTITGINGSAIKDTVYSAGDNIDITNFVISGKDWSDYIDTAVGDLAEEMASGFADLDERKVDLSSMSGYVPTSATIVKIGNNNVLTYEANDTFLQGTDNSGADRTFAQGSANYSHLGSFAQGYQNTATIQSFAQGQYNTANNSTMVQGTSNTAQTMAFAQGIQNNASVQSFAQGASNKSNSNSFAQGTMNSASNFGFAQGGGNTALDYSFTQGGSNYASGYSQAFGYGNNITNTGMVIGQYNKTSSDVAFVIGNGSKNNRSDLFTIAHDGTVSSTGDFVVSDKSLSSVYDNVSSNSSTWDAKQDALTNEQLSAISSVSSIKGTVITGDSNIRATSAEEGNNIKWTLELTAQPVVTDTTLSGFSGIVATKDSTVSSQWNVGLAQDYVSAISSISSISVITKQDIDDIWSIVVSERGA
jgi:hypothetical protein